jgi:hypothetical protein
VIRRVIAAAAGVALFAAPLAPAIVAARLISPDSLLAPDVGAWLALAAAAAFAIAVPLLTLLSPGPARSIAAAVLASAVGWVAIALVLYGTVAAPEDWPGLRPGVWVALAGAVLAWVGSWLSLRDDTTPGAVATDLPRRPAPA